MWQWHLWAGPGAPGVWVLTEVSEGQGDPGWPPWPGSGLAGSGLGSGQMGCQRSPLWAALFGTGCCSTRSPEPPPGGPAADRPPGCRRRRRSSGAAANDPPAVRLCSSARRTVLSLATISASGCQGHLFPEAPRSCGEERLELFFFFNAQMLLKVQRQLV